MKILPPPAILDLMPSEQEIFCTTTPDPKIRPPLSTWVLVLIAITMLLVVAIDGGEGLPGALLCIGGFAIYRKVKNSGPDKMLPPRSYIGVTSRRVARYDNILQQTTDILLGQVESVQVNSKGDVTVTGAGNRTLKFQHAHMAAELKSHIYAAVENRNAN